MSVLVSIVFGTVNSHKWMCISSGFPYLRETALSVFRIFWQLRLFSSFSDISLKINRN